jgi:serine protease Do
VTVDRDGKRIQTKVVIGDREEQRAASEDPRFSRRGDSGEHERAESTGAKFGLRIRPANETERENAGIDKGGVVITTVEPGSFADDIGLQERDIVISVNRTPVASIEDIRALQAKLKAGDAVAFRVMRPSPFPQRGGRPQYVGSYIAGTLPTAQP